MKAQEEAPIQDDEFQKKLNQLLQIPCISRSEALKLAMEKSVPPQPTCPDCESCPYEPSPAAPEPDHTCTEIESGAQ